MSLKFFLSFFACLLILLPFKVSAQEKLEAPNLVEVRIGGQFVDKSKINLAKDQVMELSGTAKPNSQVYLYFDKVNPLVAQVSVDKDGNWLYRLNQVLDSGSHTVLGETHEGDAISANVELLKFKVIQGNITIPGTSTEIVYSLFVVLVMLVIILFGVGFYLYPKRKSIFKKWVK